MPCMFEADGGTLTSRTTLINLSEVKSVSVLQCYLHVLLPIQILQLHAIQQTVAGEYINTQTLVAHAADCMYR